MNKSILPILALFFMPSVYAEPDAILSIRLSPNSVACYGRVPLKCKQDDGLYLTYDQTIQQYLGAGAEVSNIIFFQNRDDKVILEGMTSLQVKIRNLRAKHDLESMENLSKFAGELRP